jgi:Protein of unknown function (DUF4058)
MPVHDWTLVDDGIFHHFHVTWVPEISIALNAGLLPQGYYALAEQHLNRRLAIRHVSCHQLVALLEIVSPGIKDRAEEVEDFVDKLLSTLEHGVHVLVVDLLFPGPNDPQGMNGAILERLEQSDEPYYLPSDKPLTLASYAAGPRVEVFVENAAVGAALPEMPLFLRPDRYISVPLETTYQTAFRGVPGFWRDVLEGRSPPVH